MRGVVKNVEFIQFDFSTKTNTKITVECSYNFIPQYPSGTDDKVLAIMVDFRAKAPDDSFHFYAKCRVVFDFTNEAILPDKDELIAENRRVAYQAFCKKTNDALVILGQNCFSFHEI